MSHLKGEIQAIGGKISSANWCGKDPTDLFGPEFEFSLPNIAFEICLEMLIEPREGESFLPSLPQFFTIDAYLNYHSDLMFEGPTSSNHESRFEFLSEAVDQIRALRRSVNPDEVEVADLCKKHYGYGKLGYRFKIKPENGLNDVKRLLGLLSVFE